MIKNIVFDMGNVLISFKPKEIIKHYSNNQDDQDILLTELFQSTYWLQFDRGTITKDELVDKVSKHLPTHLQSVSRQILDNWYEDIHPITEMGRIIEELKSSGTNLYILSNASSDFHQFKTKIPKFDLFDGIFLSSDWRMLKPEKEMYTTFYAHFNLNPAECFFIDDLPANIESAQTTGMNGFIFRNNVEELGNYLHTMNRTI